MNTPSIVNGQSAEKNTLSNIAEWTQEMFNDSAKRQGTRQAKGVTRERRELNRSKLISAVCADYRSHFAALYGKTDRLPSEVFVMIEMGVDNFISESLSSVHKMNVISHRRAFYHDAKNMQVTERIVNTGENLLSLQEQLLGCDIFITNCEKKLKDLETKPTPDYDREREVKQQMMKLQVTRQFIQGEVNHQKKAMENK